VKRREKREERREKREERREKREERREKRGIRVSEVVLGAIMDQESRGNQYVALPGGGTESLG
jgi:hypothetical protein